MINRHSLHTPTLWLVVAIVLLIIHGALFYYASTHLALLAAVTAGLVILVMIKHVGLFGALPGLMRRRSRHNRTGR
jgi:high-affinity Fe2+/Pb2+ permease